MEESTAEPTPWLQLVLSPGLVDREPPERIFHFTDAPGFTGIVRNSAFWASLATAQNDLMEITYGREFTRVFLEERRKDLLSKAILEATAIQGAQGTSPLDNTFVVSFCEEEEVAHHWLHYGHRGTGFALGFDRASLATSAGWDNEGTRFRLEPVLYTEEEQSTVLNQLLDNTIQSLGSDERAAQHAVVISYVVLPCLIACMKRPAFRSEREWRLVGPAAWSPPVPDGSTPTQYRASAERIIPYLECGFSPETIREVVIGASSRVTVHDPGLRMLLRDHAPKAERRKSTVLVRP